MAPSAAQRVSEVFRANLDEYVTRSCDRVRAQDSPFYRSLPLEAMRAMVKRVFEVVVGDVAVGEPRAYPAMMAAIGVQRAASGVAVTEMTSGMHLGFAVVSEDFAVRFADDPEARIFWENLRARIAYTGVAALADAYLTAREKLIRAQSEEIVALSTQVLPLYRGILVVPLVGRLDRERAQLMTARLLSAVTQHAARVVVLDISGVPAVDADTAGHLARAAQAVELLGTRPVLVGVGVAVAQAMVAGAVAFGRLTTLADLASGLEYALGVIGKTIADAPRV